MADVKVKLKIRGINAVMKSNPVQSEVARRAVRIAKAAGPGFEAVVNPAKYTARAFVRTTDDASRKAEAKDKTLTRALDAGR